MILIALAICAGWPAVAGARKRARLAYTVDGGVEGCPGQQAVETAVSERLGYEPWDPAAAERVQVTIAPRRRGKGLQARIVMRDRAGRTTGQRTLEEEAGGCRALVDAVVLAVTIAIDPLALTRPAKEPPPPPEELPPMTRRSRDKPVVKARPAPPPVDEGMHVSASLGGHVAVASAPGLAGGLALQVRLRWPRFSAALEGRVDLPATKEVPGGEVDTSLQVGSALACYHRGYGLGCAVMTLGGLRAGGRGKQASDHQTLIYAAGGIRLGLEFPLFSIISLRLHGDLLATFTHITLRASPGGPEHWTTPPISAAFGAAVAGTFF